MSDAARLPLDVYQRLNDLEAPTVARHLGLTPARERGKYACPVHGGSDSLHAYPGTGRGFFCFSCGQSWSNVDMVLAVRGGEKEDACRWLADQFGISTAPLFSTRRRTRQGRQGRKEAPAVSRDTPTPRARKSPPSAPDPLDALRAEGMVPALPPAIYRVAWDYLGMSDRGADYLRGRSFDPVAAFGYGFRSIEPKEWATLHETLAASFVDLELAASGFYRPPREGDGPLTWRVPFGREIPALVIPYWHRGELVALRFRRLDGGAEPRYVSLGGVTIPEPFGADALDGCSGQTVHVCEGEMNAFALSLHGCRVIGLPGAGSWREEWGASLRDAARVVLWLDNDPPKQLPDGTEREGAGQAATRRIGKSLQALHGRTWLSRVASVDLPRGKDANDLHREGFLDGYLASL